MTFFFPFFFKFHNAMEEFNKALPNKNYVEAANMLKQVRALGSCRYEG